MNRNEEWTNVNVNEHVILNSSLNRTTASLYHNTATCAYIIAQQLWMLLFIEIYIHITSCMTVE